LTLARSGGERRGEEALYPLGTVVHSILGIERHGAAEVSAIENNMKVIYRGLDSMIIFVFCLDLNPSSVLICFS
jgi:hypothetical protein